jgi:hypothetical protein
MLKIAKIRMVLFLDLKNDSFSLNFLDFIIVVMHYGLFNKFLFFFGFF